MMEHICQGMTLGDHSKAICTICGSDLSKPSHSELLKAIERVRKVLALWVDDIASTTEQDYYMQIVEALDNDDL